jgi:hypothetical protein
MVACDAACVPAARESSELDDVTAEVNDSIDTGSGARVAFFGPVG